MVHENTLAILGLGQDLGPDHVLTALIDTEEGEGETLTADRREGNLHKAAHVADREVGAGVRSDPDGRVDWDIIPHDNQVGNPILGVRVCKWIGQSQGHSRIPIPGSGLVPVPRVLNRQLEKGRFLDLQ